MWTPRRILLLILGVGVFGGAYGVYSRFLGSIDGLPQLPTEFIARRADSDPFLAPTQTVTDKKLLLAFGQNCEEIGYNYKLELPAKGIIIATNQYDIDPDGRLKLTPFSLATIKDRPGGAHPEIYSVHCDLGFLEFDKPVKTMQEIGTRRIVACELLGDPGILSHDPRRGLIHLLHNRGTPETDDDLSLVTGGPVSYRESSQPGLPLDKARPEISTTAAVQIIDRRNAPQSTTVTAQGMQVFLLTETPGIAAKRSSAKNSASVSGVRRVVLPANVNMNLWLDSGGAFLATAKPAAAAPAGGKAERTNLQISTMGPFTYDIAPEGDRARFDRLPPSATPLPNSVRVVRPQARSAQSVLNDQLECDALELKFAAKSTGNPSDSVIKPSKPTSARPGEPERTQIEWIHAWGQFVVLTSDEEKLEARGNDLFHDAIAKTTTLHGQPETVALKEGNEIHAPVLILHGGDDKTQQHAEARGAGYFRMLDRNGQQRTVMGRWKDRLVFRKEESRDALTLTGEATFEDPASGQFLRGDTIKLVMSPDSKGIDPRALGTTGSRPKPQRLEAYGNVVARAPEINVQDTEELVVLFKDPTPPPVPAAAPSSGTPASAPPSPAPAPAVGIGTKSRNNEKPKQPINLRARRIQVFLVMATGDQTQLDRVDCEGNVFVHQDPTAPQTKPVEMRGTGLNLRHLPEGNILEVKGDLQTPGEVTLPELELIGPYIKIDQVENVAEVVGIGSMKFESQTDLQGKKLDRPMPLMVTWKQKMRFNGTTALFHGHVQADQAETSLLCNNMQVFLNRPVSLQQPQPGQQRPADSSAANVDKVICDNQGQTLPQPVTITENVRGPDGKLLRYQRIETDTVAMHKEEGLMEAGPGAVRILQPGTKSDNPLAPPPNTGGKPAAKDKPAEEEYKLTWIRYGRALRVNNPNRTATFHKNVEVLHLPKDDPCLQSDFGSIVDRLPPGAVFLSCERLDVYGQKTADGRTQQQFTATERARVQAAEFYGSANVIKYDEAKQLIVFEGSDGANAELYLTKVKGGDAQTIKAKKITYNRQTGAFKTDETRMITAGGSKR